MSTCSPQRVRRDINFVILKDGRSVFLDDIATAAEGQAILDDLDCAILTIRAQIEAAEVECRPWHWRKSARLALSKKVNIRPRLQQRIAELRRSEKQAAHVALMSQPKTSKRRDKAQAFVDAARELLPAETVVEIWARAAEREPGTFAGKEIAA